MKKTLLILLLCPLLTFANKQDRRQRRAERKVARVQYWKGVQHASIVAVSLPVIVLWARLLIKAPNN